MIIKVQLDDKRIEDSRIGEKFILLFGESSENRLIVKFVGAARTSGKSIFNIEFYNGDEFGISNQKEILEKIKKCTKFNLFSFKNSEINGSMEYVEPMIEGGSVGAEAEAKDTQDTVYFYEKYSSYIQQGYELHFGDVDLSGSHLTEIPEKWKNQIVIGEFNISRNDIVYLKNCPLIIEGDFLAHHNLLLTLTNGPKIVTGKYNVHANRIFCLKGIPENVPGFQRFGGHPIAGYQMCGSYGGSDKDYEQHLDNCFQNQDYLPESAKLLNGNKLVSFKGFPNEVSEEEINSSREEAFNKYFIKLLSEEERQFIRRELKEWDKDAYQWLKGKINSEYGEQVVEYDLLAEQIDELKDYVQYLSEVLEIILKYVSVEEKEFNKKIKSFFKNKNNQQKYPYKIDILKDWGKQMYGPQGAVPVATSISEYFPALVQLTKDINKFILDAQLYHTDFSRQYPNLDTSKEITIKDVANTRIGDIEEIKMAIENFKNGKGLPIFYTACY
jgi:hypothetical protein